MDLRARVSVCIPVYGVEKYIEKCARTLFEQTLQDIEYIFVDDCTPDRSIEILQKVLEEYPHRKNQVKIIRHEINQGVGAARNHAVAACTGEYVIHCDPDDWIELDMYETMYNKAKEAEADMVYCGFYHVCEKNKSCSINNSKIESPLEMLKRIYCRQYEPALWNKMFRREIAQHRSISCPDKIIVGEDMLRNTLMLPLCKKIIGIEKNFYNYQERDNSAFHSKNKKRVVKQIKDMMYVSDFAESSNLVDNESIMKNKIFILKFAWNINCDADFFYSLYPDVRNEILKYNMRFDYKILFFTAKYSYRLAMFLNVIRLWIGGVKKRIRDFIK